MRKVLLASAAILAGLIVSVPAQISPKFDFIWLNPGGVPSPLNDGKCWVTTAGLFCRINGTTKGPYIDTASGGGIGSIGLILPNIFNAVTNSPLTSDGNLTATLANQSANTVFAGPVSGSAAPSAFRPLVGADLPNPASTTLGGVQSTAPVTHQFVTGISTSGVPSKAQPAAADVAGLAASATIDTTNASNITTGQLGVARGGSPVQVIATVGPASVTGTTSTTLFSSLKIPANSLGLNGSVNVSCLVTYTNNANLKTLGIFFHTAPDVVTGSGLNTGLATATGASAQVFFVLRNNNAANAQVSYAPSTITPFGTSAAAPNRFTIDTTADSYLTFGGTLAVGTDTITLEHCSGLIMGSTP